MSLSATPTDPPVVTDGTIEGSEDGERRQELQAFLSDDDAWGEGFYQWADETQLADDDPATAPFLSMVQSLDFYWNPASERVEYEVPAVPDDWGTRPACAGIDSWSTASMVDEELDSLGETVANTLDDYFVDWEPTERRDSTYHELFGEQFNGGDDFLEGEEREE